MHSMVENCTARSRVMSKGFWIQGATYCSILKCKVLSRSGDWIRTHSRSSYCPAIRESLFNDWSTAVAKQRKKSSGGFSARHNRKETAHRLIARAQKMILSQTSGGGWWVWRRAAGRV